MSAATHVRDGNALRARARHADALVSYDRALAVDPNHLAALYNRSNTLRDLKQLEAAVVGYDRVLALDSRHTGALNNRGIVLRALGRHDEALASFEALLALKPDDAPAWNNRGNVLRALNRYEEALVSYRHALTLKPAYASAHWNEALCRLVLGDFGRGWEKHEWRWQRETFTSARRNFAQPLWLGQQSLNGKTILLHAEQGLGDTIQFCRYAPLVAARGATVLLEAQPALRSLLATLDGVEQVLDKGEKLPSFDFHCPLLSLPLAFNTDLESIPAAVPYLHAPADHLARWRERLGKKMTPRVGIAWSGKPKHKNDANRSLALSALAPLLDRGVQLVSLQKEVRPGDRTFLGEHPDILHFGEALVDFADTAALVSLLDLIISVDTSVAHLAGALGKPIWVLLSFSPDWRWLLDRSDSPWYPTARLFRQPSIGNWAHPIRLVADELDRTFGNAGQSTGKGTPS